MAKHTEVSEEQGTPRRSTRTRRRMLQVCGAAVTLSVAGCLGGDDETDGDEDDGGDDTDPNGDDTDSNGHDDPDPSTQFDTVLEDLVAVAQSLSTYADDGDAQPTESDIDSYETQLDDASATLDDIEPEADGELSPKVEAARDVIDIQTAILGYWEHATEWEHALDVAIAYWDTDQYDQADEQFRDAIAATEAIEPQLDTIETALESATTDPLEEPELAYDEPVWAYVGLDEAGERAVMQSFTEGYLYLNTLLDQTLSGTDQYELGNYEAAEADFSIAVEAAEDTISKFTSIEDDPATPSEILADIISLRGLAEDWHTAVQYFEEAASIAQEGTIEEADTRFEEGLAELED